MGYSVRRNRRLVPLPSTAPPRAQDQARLTVGESDIEFEHPSLPDRILLSGDSTLPFLQVQDALSVAVGFRIEAERVVTTPLLSVRGRKLAISACDEDGIGEDATGHDARLLHTSPQSGDSDTATFWSVRSSRCERAG